MLQESSLLAPRVSIVTDDHTVLSRENIGKVLFHLLDCDSSAGGGELEESEEIGLNPRSAPGGASPSLSDAVITTGCAGVTSKRSE